MSYNGNKKLSILCILEILKDYSDENHLLSQTEIVKKLNSIYGIECERKSVGANIDNLIDFGFDITKIPHKGCYIGERILEPSEVSFIVDVLFSSKSISGSQAKELSSKLSNLLSKYQRKRYNYIYKAEQVNRTNNKELFYNIEIIQEAIEKNKKISFNYIRPHYEKDNPQKVYIVNPYFLVNNQGRYYLICNFDYFNEIGNYKIDFIKNIKILDEERKPITNIKDFEKGIDISKYINEHIYVFGDKTINATIKLADDNSITYVMEWFGKNAKIYKKNNTTYADIVSSEKALVYWCLQYGESVELLFPKQTRDKIKSILDKVNKKYD